MKWELFSAREVLIYACDYESSLIFVEKRFLKKYFLSKLLYIKYIFPLLPHYSTRKAKNAFFYCISNMLFSVLICMLAFRANINFTL